jgi:nicotinamide N-methyltransferase
LFSPALIIAERIECGLIPLSGKTVLELGAGAALPSLLASTLDVDVAPSMVVVTDYPDASIMGNVERNVSQNSMLVTPKVKVLSIGHEWGTHPTPLL